MKNSLFLLLLSFAVFWFSIFFSQSGNTFYNKEELGVFRKDSVFKYDENTGLIIAPNYLLVVGNCTGCHSSKLIIQYGTDRTNWLAKIRWMQQYHKLWDLGDAEKPILDYLEKYYPEKKSQGRRKPLGLIEWYKLEK
jgi:hypothetical protein